MAHISTVLVVDDMAAIHQMIHAVLRNDGYRLEFASTGYEALAKAAEIGPDLVLLDVMMPGMDGFETCRQLRSMPGLAEVPVIMITALADRTSRLKGIEAGADDFISKPFDQTELRARVRSIIRLNRYRRLLAERSRYQRLVELSPDGVAMINQQGVIQFANSALQTMLGCQNVAELMGQPMWLFIVPNQQESWERFLQGAANPAHGVLRLETALLRSNGSDFPVEITAGWLEWNGQLAVQIIVRDVTERKAVERALQQRNQDLALLNRASQMFSASLDLSQVLQTVVHELVTLFGEINASVWLVNEASGELVCRLAAGAGSEAMAQWRLPPGEGLAGRVLQNGQPLLVADTQQDGRDWQQMDQATGIRWRSLLGAPLTTQEGPSGVLYLAAREPSRFTLADRSLVEALAAIAAIAIENARLFQTVDDHRGQLRALAGRLAEVQEQERQQLARELHDQIGQNLTAMSLNMNALDQMAPTVLNEALHGRLHDTIQLLGQTARQVRSVMAELRPPVLDDYGLAAALRWYGEQFAHRTGVVVQIQTQENQERLPLATETALFRIAQEALNNVAKHAAARDVVLRLHQEDGLARLTIADDGQGFDPQAIQSRRKQPHWGLLTMQERAMAAGGALQILSRPGAGTEIIVEVKR